MKIDCLISTLCANNTLFVCLFVVLLLINLFHRDVFLLYIFCIMIY